MRVCVMGMHPSMQVCMHGDVHVCMLLCECLSVYACTLMYTIHGHLYACILQNAFHCPDIVFMAENSNRGMQGIGIERWMH